jgi:pimeloyl-ACP methyl ester carboxylesterase
VGWTMRHLVFSLPLLSVVCCLSYVIEPGSFRFQGKHPIAYERARVATEHEWETGEEPSHPPGFSADNNSTNVESAPLLLLNGFGVGSFHQHRLIEKLFDIDSNENRTVYAMDYLGQGKSWPEDCNDGQSTNERGLRYCGTTWVQQILDFIRNVVLPQHPGHSSVHVCGNSVGGHLAVCLAAAHPDLVASLCLLNPTPVWGLNLPGWSGHLPAPLIPKLIGGFLFDRIRDLRTLELYLASAYANAGAYDTTLVQQIRACTEGSGGHAAFASIMWSPPVRVPIAGASRAGFFDECLRNLNCDVLLVFGRDDPWCKPAFAKRMLGDLNQRVASPPPNVEDKAALDADHTQSPVARYVELSNVGHCPNHEAPTAVARLLSTWIVVGSGSSRSKLARPLLRDGEEVVRESWGRTNVAERTEDEIQLTFTDRLALAIVS